jgi:hypothetical protein
MTTVFVAGSINIKRLHPLFIERLSNIASSNMAVVVGDANGADTSIQKSLLAKNASPVTVYCSGLRPRNNVGNWPVQSVFPEEEAGTRAYFTAKDLEMARVADYGLMLWDAKSTGTLSNVIELLKRSKKCVVFVNKEKVFITVSDIDGLKKLVNVMSETARIKAENKIKLSSKISRISSEQLGLPL